MGLYGTDGEFHPTFTSGMQKHRFTIPLLMTLRRLIAQSCTPVFSKILLFGTGYKCIFHPQIAQILPVFGNSSSVTSRVPIMGASLDQSP